MGGRGLSLASNWRRQLPYWLKMGGRTITLLVKNGRPHHHPAGLKWEATATACYYSWTLPGLKWEAAPLPCWLKMGGRGLSLASNWRRQVPFWLKMEAAPSPCWLKMGGRGHCLAYLGTVGGRTTHHFLHKKLPVRSVHACSLVNCWRAGWWDRNGWSADALGVNILAALTVS
jgi:hypothetical protein